MGQTNLATEMIRAHKDGTRHDIYRQAVQKLMTANKSYSLEFLASRLGIRVTTVYNWLEGKNVPSTFEEERLFVECNFVDEGYKLKINFLINHK